jgi:porin
MSLRLRAFSFFISALTICGAMPHFAQAQTRMSHPATAADLERVFADDDSWIRPVNFESAACDTCAQPISGCDNTAFGCASAAGSCDDLLTRKSLTNGLFGLQPVLAENGIATQFIFGQYYQGVTTGGNEQTDAYGGKVDMYFTLLGEQFGLDKGFNVIMHAETRYGEDISGAAGSLTLPNAPMLWPLPGDYQGTNITGLMFTQQLFDDNVGLVGGKLNTLDLVQGILPDIGSGRESFLNVNALVSALPWFRFVNLSEWGAGFWTYDKNAGGQIAHGFIAFGLSNASNNWDFARQFEDGVGMLGWLRFFHEIDGRPGWIAVFVGGATREYTSTDPQDFLIVPGEGLVSTSQKMPIDVAPYFSQVLWQDESNTARNIRLTVGGTIADANPSFSNWNAFGKLEGYGLQRSRAGDRMGIAGWYNGISPNIKNITAAIPGVLDAQDNWGVELYYNREITPWFHLTGDMQVLQNSIDTTDTSLVLGLRAIIDI